VAGAGGSAGVRTPRPGPPAAEPGSDASPRLVHGTQLHGKYQGSGCIEPGYLIGRADGTVVEVSPLLFRVASSIDGTRCATDIAAAMSDGVTRRITGADVDYLIAHKLRPLGVVEPPLGVPLRPSSSPPLLGLAFRAAVVPQRAVGTATAWLRPLFRPAVVGFVLACLIGVDVRLLVGHDIGSATADLATRPSLLLLAIVVTLLAGAFHELGHATACRYGGAEPGRIGVGIYLLWPVFYNDLTDSYRLSRRGRLRADVGGVYFNIVLIVALAGVYGVTGFRPLIGVIVVQPLLILQQFLPFVRLDGYYILSDLSGVPDLFHYIRPVLSSLLPRRRPAPRLLALRAGPRAVVTAWVLVTVPLLVGCAGLLAVRVPHLVWAASEAARVHALALGGALHAGAVIRALVSGVQLLFVAIPLAGLAFTLLRVVIGLGRRLGDR